MSEITNAESYSKVIKQVIAKELTQETAASKLGISARHVRRLIAKYKNLVMMLSFTKTLEKKVITKKSQMTLQMRLSITI